MSHITKVKVQFKDVEALKKACQKLHVKVTTGPHTVRLYSGSISTDLSLKIPGWRYPVAIKDNEAVLDNYNGSWGSMSSLDDVKQGYAVEVAKKKAKNLGFQVTEKQKQDGTIQLVLLK